MRDRGVLVTGGAGFIGSHLVDLLMENGYTVYVLDDLSTGKLDNIEQWMDNGNFRFIRGDIREPLDNTLTPSKLGGGPPIGTIFHLAARVDVTSSFNDPRSDMEVNYLGTLNVMDHAWKTDVHKIVFASSAAVYGDTDKLPISEGSEIDPLSPYGLNKFSSEMLFRIYHSQYGLDYTVLRFFNVYGPRQDPDNPYSGVISKFMNWGRKGEPLMIYGDGVQTRDFIYVGDVAQIMMAAAGSSFVGTMNVATGMENSILDLAEGVEDILGKTLKRVYLPERKGEIIKSTADVTRLRELVEPSQMTSLKEGLRATYRWFETQPDRVVN
jgi:UDP-glucose 4-epimerase